MTLSTTLSASVEQQDFSKFSIQFTIAEHLAWLVLGNAQDWKRKSWGLMGCKCGLEIMLSGMNKSHGTRL